MDGVDGPAYAGTGCIHHRDALCGTEGRHVSSKSTVDYTVSKPRASPSKMLKDAADLGKCACEENTLSGKNANPTCSFCFNSLIVFILNIYFAQGKLYKIAGWNDLWLCCGRFFDRLRYTVQRL